VDKSLFLENSKLLIINKFNLGKIGRNDLAPALPSALLTKAFWPPWWENCYLIATSICQRGLEKTKIWRPRQDLNLQPSD
jgi:hypothetical protein